MAASFTLGRNSKSGKIFNILDVSYPERLEFECIKCFRPLKCVLNHPSPHFKHKSNLVLNCNPTPESLLHMAAKEILLAHNSILLPENDEIYHYDSAIAEQKLTNQRQPDVLLKQGKDILLVEIVVTNKLNHQKIEDYKAFGKRCLVIDLSDYERLFDIQKLKDEVITSTGRKSLLDLKKIEVLENYTKPEQTKDDDGFLILLAIAAVGAVGIAISRIFPGLFKTKNHRSQYRRRKSRW